MVKVVTLDNVFLINNLRYKSGACRVIFCVDKSEDHYGIYASMNSGYEEDEGN